MRLIASLVLVGWSMSTHAAELSALEAEKIDYLIVSVAELHQGRFIRNGISHDAKSAAAHLRRKLRAAGSRITSADDFIDLCASASSVTGRPYRIRFADGREIDAKEYFRQKLAEYPAER
jgi:hypothetical protein